MLDCLKHLVIKWSLLSHKGIQCNYNRLENVMTELSECSFDQKLVNMVITYALAQHVNDVTRYDPDSASSSLDQILTHYEDDVTNLYYMTPLGESDYAV